MSNSTPPTDPPSLSVESGLAALRESPQFRGPVEPHTGHQSNDHLALLYETAEEQLGAAIPFIEQGLARDERCLYVADENSKDEVVEAMRTAGVAVDDARDSGALTLHTSQDTYYREDDFDPDRMVEFLTDATDEALDEYTGLRIAAEMTWVFGADPPLEELIEYEAKVSQMLPDIEAIALCQYNQNRFPADILTDVIRTHPHLIYDNTVCQNYYYTPPEEFFGPGHPEREVKRMVETLRERTEATAALADREQELQAKTERLESFATLVAHELRNPVAIGQIYSQQLPDTPGSDAVDHVEDSFERIEDMIDILLVVTRGREAVGAGSQLRLRDVAQTAWENAKTADATLEITLTQSVQADSTYIEHLFRNLFENAVEHGGDHVTVTAGDLQNGFYVADNGPGIPPEDRDRVFNAGYTTTADNGGTGVGLAFVSALAEVYEWNVAITESEQGGARVEFTNVPTTPSDSEPER